MYSNQHSTPIKEYGHKIEFMTYDVYGDGLDNEVSGIQTFYEKKWLEHGTKIKYLKFTLNPETFQD